MTKFIKNTEKQAYLSIFRQHGILVKIMFLPAFLILTKYHCANLKTKNQ